MEVFAERGYGAAKLDEVAHRAGVAKGTVFVYFPTKEDLFRAVAQAILAAHLERLAGAGSDLELPLTTLIPLLLEQAALTGQSRAAAVIRLLIAEARTFPDLAQVWHDEVLGKVLGVVTAAIERAQARGEIRSGDPKLYAFSIMGPILAGVVFREVFQQTDVALPDLSALAKQHAQAILHGLVLV
jgi:AcrR family transcriptional regulator